MKVETSIEFACPPEAVWPWLVESERMKQWMKGLLEIRPLGAPAPRAGAEYELVIREGGRIEVYCERIVEFEPHRRLAIELTGGWADTARRPRCRSSTRSRISAHAPGSSIG